MLISVVYLYSDNNNIKTETMINLNTISKEDFATELLMSEDCNDFYIKREKQILSLDFDFEQMKKDFENWLINNCDN